MTCLNKDTHYLYRAIYFRVKVVVCELSHYTSLLLYMSFSFLFSHFLQLLYFNNFVPNNHGHNWAQAVNCQLSQRRAELNHGKVHAGFLENKVVDGQVLFHYLSFACH